MKNFFLLFLLTISFFVKSQNLETVVQRGHSASIKSCTVSSDGNYLLTASRDRSAKLWDLHTGMEIRSFLSHQHTVNNVCFSKDAKYLATSSADNTFKLWETNSGNLLYTSENMGKYLTSVAISPDGKWLIGGGYADSAWVIDLYSHTLVAKIGVSPDQGSGTGISLEFSPNGKWLGIGEDNRTVSVFDCTNWKKIATLTDEVGQHWGAGSKLKFSADNKLIFRYSKDSKPCIYSTDNWKLVKEYTDKFEEGTTEIALKSDASVAYLATENAVLSWTISTNKIDTLFKADTLGEINDIALVPNSNLMVMVGSKSIGKLMDIETKKLVHYFSGINNAQNSTLNYNSDNYWESNIAYYIRLKNHILIGQDNQSFINGKSGNNIMLWDMKSGRPDRTFTFHTDPVLCFDLSIDGKLVSGDNGGTIIISDFKTGKKLKTFKESRRPIFEVKFSVDGSQIIATSWDGSVRVWDVITSKLLSEVEWTDQSAFTAALTPDKMYFISAGMKKSLEMYEPDSRLLVRSFIGHSDVVSCIQFHPINPSLMLTSSWDGSVRLWDLNTGLQKMKYISNDSPKQSIVFSTDGKTFYAAGDDRVIRKWSTEDGKLLKTLEGHQAEITCLKLSSDGKLLLSYGVDGAMKCWDIEKNRAFYEHFHFGKNDWMARTDDGYFNSTSDAQKLIHFVKGNEVFSSDQFFEQFYRPDLLPKLFKERGSVEQNDDMGNYLDKSPPPLVKLAYTLLENGTKAEIRVKMTDQGGEVNSLRVTHNGKVIVLPTQVDYPKGKNAFSVYKFTVNLVGGNNIFSAVAFSANRIESAPVKIELFSALSQANSVCHLVAIGINDYVNPKLHLNYAKPDAESVVDLFKKNGSQLYKDIKIHALYDKQATKANIISLFTKLALEVSSHDVIVFYYAGHGSMQDNQFYFIPVECARIYEQEALVKTALSAIEFRDLLIKVKALKQVMIIDACQSGGSVDQIAMRGTMEEKAIAQLSRSTGMHILASAGSDQFAKELEEYKHGLFTYVLLQAFSGLADGAPNDGKITIFELKSYLDDQIPELNKINGGKMQFPYTFSRGNDFPLLLKK